VHVGVNEFGLSKKVVGLHVTVPSPVTSNVKLFPKHKLVSSDIPILLLNTSKVTSKVCEPQVSDTVTEKVVVSSTVAIGFEMFGLSNKFAGSHS
jgi:hypothetical protein